jgi:hypothetical protein
MPVALVPRVLVAGALVGTPEDAMSGAEDVGPPITGTDGTGLGATVPGFGTPLDGVDTLVTVADGDVFCESVVVEAPEQAVPKPGTRASTETSKGDELFTSLL